ncbi:MAG: peptide ABC transporter substrate-binding protein, partial [Cellulomonadaceae bacterium]|nr:peptide ABC transporter substrate-binding protein [Cellulomonadaceae bacterium]
LGGTYPLSFFRLASHRPWDTVTTMLSPTSVWNPLRTQDPEVDDLIARIQASTGSEQDALFRELNDYVIEQAWFVPWDEPEIAYVTSTDIIAVQEAYSAIPPLYNFAPAN